MDLIYPPPRDADSSPPGLLNYTLYFLGHRNGSLGHCIYISPDSPASELPQVHIGKTCCLHRGVYCNVNDASIDLDGRRDGNPKEIL